jgi:Excalibur calcium-binding domain
MLSPRTAASVSALAAAAMLILPGTAAAQDLYNCDDFQYQEEAQAIFEQDRSDPHRLDRLRGPGNGKACEDLPSRSAATTPTTTTATPAPTTRTTPAVAPMVVSPTTSATATTGSTTGATTTSATSSATTTTTTTTTTSAADTTTAATTAADDQDCVDFPTQAAAQAALAAEPSDPDRLDADGDGVACEEHFGTEAQQVQVLPVGGVDTGGWQPSA